ncbi:MAG: peptidylprolyl isomerase [Helicobacteraceae bacterium]|jgi:FKBP-type peptidyl-prolyl cis-trans isomerase SlyD|nr:peptidylprolyl isomerase [Helicobacteraceae bacterium]
MAIARNTVVSIEYEVKNAVSGEMIDSNKGGDPLEFLMGAGHIVQGLEEAIAQMSEGESKTLIVPSAKAYGIYDESAVENVDIEQFAGIELTHGMTLYGEADDGQSVRVTVKTIGDKSVTIDYNHPLAGKDLSFDVKVIKTREATSREIQTGALEDSCCGGEHGHCCC